MFADRRKHGEMLYANLQVTLHNAWFRSKTEHPQPWTVNDFIGSTKPVGKQTWQQQRQVLGAIFEKQKIDRARARGVA